MLHRSLTAKVLLAVGVTVAAVIAIYTYFVIRVQSAWWHERTQAQNLIASTVVHEYLNGVMLSDRHEEVQRFLMKMQKSDEIWRGRIIRPDGIVVFSTATQEIGHAVMNLPEELFSEGKVLQGVRTENGQHFAVAMRPVAGSETCRKCHKGDQPYIGAIVTERSMEPAETSVATNRALLIGYGALIFLLVGIVLWLLIVRLISQPVSSLLEQMRRVERGDFTARAEAQRPDEIGELARDFNAMVRSLQNAKQALDESHEKQMQQASKLASIGELASGIAHEIRNPLAGIGAAVEVLADNRAGTDGEIVQEIRRQITRLNTTLRELLDFSRQREPVFAPCSVADVIRPMIALIRPDAQKNHVAITEELPADLPPIMADSGQAQQAILNVLLNAMQAMSTGGNLTVRAQTADGKVRIRITDTGEGIPPENLQRIFSPFFTTKHRGTGLGLAITRSIMEKHQGHVSVESELGRGTTFTLEFAACEISEVGGEVATHAEN